MSTHDKSPSTDATPETDAPPGSPVTPANRDRATIIVWRVTPDTPPETVTPPNPAEGDSPLSSRLARRLVEIYSDVHDTVIDFDDDPRLRTAAESVGRTYRTIADPAGPSADGDLGTPAALIVMRWPRPTTQIPGSDVSSLLNRCQRHVATNGATIIVVTATAGDDDSASYADHEGILLPAAAAVGLQHLHDIVPLDADDGRDCFIYAPDHCGRVSSGGDDLDAVRQIAVTTLVIFGRSGRRR
jgi:hypothetical protein